MPYIRRLDSGRYHVQVKRRGRAWHATFTTKTAARQWGLELEDRLDRGIERDPYSGRMTVDEFAGKWWAARSVEPTTADVEESRWRVHVQPRWGAVPLEAIDTLDVQAWTVELGRQMRPASVHKCFRLLAVILADAVRTRRLSANPCEYVRLPPLPRGREIFLTHEQVGALETVCSERDALVIATLAWEGLRWGELAGLKVGRLDMLRGRVSVRETVTRHGPKAHPKTSRSRRTIPMPEDLRDRLAAYLAANPAGRDDYVFRNANGGPLSDSNFRHRAWIPACEEVGLEPRPTIHDLRHTCASWLVQAGVPLYDVRDFLGHESIASTERYSHLAPDTHSRIRDVFRTPGRTPEQAYGDAQRLTGATTDHA